MDSHVGCHPLWAQSQRYLDAGDCAGRCTQAPPRDTCYECLELPEAVATDPRLQNKVGTHPYVHNKVVPCSLRHALRSDPSSCWPTSGNEVAPKQILHTAYMDQQQGRSRTPGRCQTLQRCGPLQQGSSDALRLYASVHSARIKGCHRGHTTETLWHFNRRTTRCP